MAGIHFRMGVEAMEGREFVIAIKEFKKAYLIHRDPEIIEQIAEAYGYCLNDRPNGIYYAKKYLLDTPPDGRYRSDATRLMEKLSEKPLKNRSDVDL